MKYRYQAVKMAVILICVLAAGVCYSCDGRQEDGYEKTFGCFPDDHDFRHSGGCGKQDTQEPPKVEIDYGNSELYTQEDMDAAIQVIEAEFATWEGCELHSLAYGGDAACTNPRIPLRHQPDRLHPAGRGAGRRLHDEPGSCSHGEEGGGVT